MAQESEFKRECFRGRECIEAVKEEVLSIRNDVRNGVFDMSAAKDEPEVMANLTLAYRHLEDARMRIGKAIQAYDGKDILPR